MQNIFIIDEKGEIMQLNNSYKKSYPLLNEIVDQLFPKLDWIWGNKINRNLVELIFI